MGRGPESDNIAVQYKDKRPVQVRLNSRMFTCEALVRMIENQIANVHANPPRHVYIKSEGRPETHFTPESLIYLHEEFETDRESQELFFRDIREELFFANEVVILDEVGLHT